MMNKNMNLLTSLLHRRDVKADFFSDIRVRVVIFNIRVTEFQAQKIHMCALLLSCQILYQMQLNHRPTSKKGPACHTPTFNLTITLPILQIEIKGPSIALYLLGIWKTSTSLVLGNSLTDIVAVETAKYL
jgi:hypothetical protein